MADISSSQISTLYPQQGDSLRALFARFIRSRLPSSPIQILASAARTTSTASTSFNIGGQDVAIFLNCTAASGVSGIQPYLRAHDSAGNDLNILHSGINAMTAPGNSILLFRKGMFLGRVSASGTIVSANVPLPERVSVFVNHAGADSYTYSVSYQLMGIQ
jgi:hypothetical protein